MEKYTILVKDILYNSEEAKQALERLNFNLGEVLDNATEEDVKDQVTEYQESITSLVYDLEQIIESYK